MTRTALPDLRRLRYFHGQLLGAEDLRREQEYFREKLRLRNRCEHGHGVVCGLLVEPIGPDYPCDPPAERDAGPRVRVTAGLAVDCAGDEIVVARPHGVDLWRALPSDERRNFRDGDSLYLSICYCEQPVEPARAVYTDSCGDTMDCAYSWTKDSYRLRISASPPAVDRCPDPCCGACPDPCLLLARIDGVVQGAELDTAAVHMEVRRPFSRYRFTTITGIGWTHGGTYTREAAKEILGTEDKSKGIVVQFSDEVQVESLQRGVVELHVVEGGSDRHSGSWFIDGDFADLPTAGLTDRFRYCQRGDESLQRGDQVMITVRTPFILDRCCRPVDGAHVGGRVPILPDYPEGERPEAPDPDPCALPPSGIGPWTSGTGTGAGVFESWFFVEDRSGK